MSQANTYILHGRPGSGSSAVEAVLALTGLPHETLYFQKRAEGTLPPEIFAINPLGQVPVLRMPDGSIMTESAAIVIHLADLVPDAGLAPPIGSPDRAVFLRVMVFMAANTYMTDLRYFYPERYADGEAQAPGVKAKALEEQERNWSALESMAASDEAMLASGFSAADLYLAMLVSWSEIEDFAAKWPKLHGIAVRISNSPQLQAIWQRNSVAF